MKCLLIPASVGLLVVVAAAGCSSPKAKHAIPEDVVKEWRAKHCDIKAPDTAGYAVGDQVTVMAGEPELLELLWINVAVLADIEDPSIQYEGEVTAVPDWSIKDYDFSITTDARAPKPVKADQVKYLHGFLSLSGNTACSFSSFRIKTTATAVFEEATYPVEILLDMDEAEHMTKVEVAEDAQASE